MVRASFFPLLVVLAALLSATAANAKDPGNGNGNGNDGSNGNGNANGNGNGNANVHAKDDEPGNPPATTPPSTSVPGGTPPPSGVSVKTDAEQALEAVQSHRALPLEDIVAVARSDHPGKLIDARLITVDSFLLYEIKLIEPDGEVVLLYYYAKSGREVQQD